MQPPLSLPRADPRLHARLRREIDRLEHDTPSRSHLARLAREIRHVGLDYRGRSLDAWLANLHVDVRAHAPELAIHELLDVCWNEAGLTALPLVLAACDDPEPGRQLGALFVLAGIPARASLSHLITALRSPRLLARLLALQAVCELGEAGREARTALLDSLGGHDPRERALAARALRFAWVGRGDDSLVAALQRALDDPSSWVREEVALALADLGPHARVTAPQLREWVMLDDAAGPTLARAAARLDLEPLITELVAAWQSARDREAKRRALARLEWLGVRTTSVVEQLPLALDDHERLLVHARAGAGAAALVPRLDAHLRGCSRFGFHELLIAACLADIRHDVGREAVERRRANEQGHDIAKLHPDRVLLARLCGLEPATARGLPAPASRFAAWLEQLAELGPLVQGRVVLALARVLLTIWEHAYPLDHPPRRLVEAYELWLAHPSAVGRVMIERAARFDFLMGTDSHARRAGHAILMLERSVAPTREGMLRFAADALAATRVELAVRVEGRCDRLESVPGCAAAEQLREAIELELLGWALGVWDPLAVVAALPIPRHWLAYRSDDPSQPIARQLDPTSLGRDGFARLVELAERREWAYERLDAASMHVEFGVVDCELRWDPSRCQVIVTQAGKTARFDVGAAFDPTRLLDHLEASRARG